MCGRPDDGSNEAVGSATSNVWMLVRSEVRARWRATLGLALLVGLASGASMAAAAGARRTDTAYPRFLEKYGRFHVDVSTGGDPATDAIFDEIARLPQVVATSRASLFFGTLTARGHTLSFPDVFLTASHEAEGSSAPQLKVVRGRVADPEAVDEAVVGYALAEKLGLSPGDTLTVSISSQDDAGGTGTGEPEIQKLKLVGVVAVAGGFETLTGRGFPNIVRLTPAFFATHQDLALTDGDTLAVELRRGDADIPAFADELRTRRVQTDGPPQPASAYTADVQAVNRVPVVTLWVAAGLLAFAALAIVGQAVAREILAAGEDFPTLRALGMSRGALTAVSAIRTTLVAVIGATIAVGVAVVASPLMPLGLARIAEPDPGHDADGLVLGVGAAVVLVGICAFGILQARRAARRAEGIGIRGGDVRPTAIADAIARAGMPASITSGVRFAAGTAGRGEPVPARAALLGTTFAVAAVTAALVFASSLGHLVREPRLFGYSWDAAVIAEPSSLGDVAGSLPRDLVADTWEGAFFHSVRVDDLLLDAFVSDGPPASIITGRPPETPDEVVLDPRTLDQLDKAVGDRVSVAGVPGEDDPNAAPTSRRMRVVGSFAVPRRPFQSAENAAQGAALTPAGLSSVSPDVGFDAVFARFAAGVDPIDGVQRLKEATSRRAFAVISVERLGAVRSVQRISAAPWFLGGVLALLALGTLVHTLLLTTRRRRRDLAILKTIGFVGRQVRATVASLTLAIVAPALLLGIPIGVAIGRWGWRLFAEYLAVVPEAIAPLAGTALMAMAVLAVAGLVAAAPAQLAARLRVADVLRTE